MNPKLLKNKKLIKKSTNSRTLEKNIKKDLPKLSDKITNKTRLFNNSNTPSIKNKNSSDNNSQYDTDSSDEDILIRTGNVPRKWYNEFDHAGYDINSYKVDKPEEEDEIQKFLTKAKNKNWWRNITDELNNKTVFLSDEDLAVIKRIRSGLYSSSKVKDNDDEYFEGNIPYQIYPLSNHTTSKKKFLPSSYESKQINRLAKLIKEGIIKIKNKSNKESSIDHIADIWALENTNPGLYHPTQGFSMPKPEQPYHDISYNPPEDIKLEKESNDVHTNSLISLRKIPKYEKLINDQYDRCVDIFQSARVIKKKQDLKEEDILPKLPKPEELKPYPSKDNIIFKGHSNVIKALCVDDSGDYLFSGDSAGFFIIFDTLTTKILFQTHLNDNILSIHYNKILKLVNVLCEGGIYFIRTSFLDKRISNDVLYTNIITNIQSKIVEEENNNNEEELLTNNKEDENNNSKNKNNFKIYRWQVYPQSKYKKNGIVFSIKWNDGALIKFNWHSKGDFFATLSKNSLGQSQVYIHNLSNLNYFSPLNKNKGLITAISFHPNKPHFYVCTHSNIMVYDLKQQELIRKFISNLKGIKEIKIHNYGSDFIVGTQEGQIAWFQSDLGNKPYKLMEHHKAKIKSIAYHNSHSLFSSASKNGEVLLYYGKVYDDFLTDPLIVPLNKLKSAYNNQFNEVNCMDFHPKFPWLFTGGNDKVIYMWS